MRRREALCQGHLAWFLTYTANILFYRDRAWNSFSHTWPLSVEAQFYLVWPWLIVFVPGRSLKYIFYLAIFIGLASTLYIIKIRTPVNVFGLLLTPTCMQAFGIGGFYAYRSRGDGERKQFMKVINVLLPFALLCHFYRGFSADGGHFNYWYRTLDSLISSWLIHYTITLRPGWIKTNVLENAVLVKIGRLRYGVIYIIMTFPGFFSRPLAPFGGRSRRWPRF